MDQAVGRDVWLLILGAVAGVLPWLLDKAGIEMPKPIYVGLLMLSVVLIGWALIDLRWIENLPALRSKRIALSTAYFSLACRG